MSRHRTPPQSSPSRGAEAPAPGEPGYEEWLQRVAVSPQGIDRMLVLEHLRRSPTERLELLERTVNGILELRGGRWPELS